MNTDKPKSLIEAAFKNPKQTLCRRSILIPAEPVDLNEVMKSAVEPDEDEDEILDIGAMDFLEEIGWPSTSFIFFYWQSMGPMVWQCSLYLFHTGDDLAVVWREQDAEPCRQAIAGIRHPDDSAVMSAFFKALIRENGAAFNVELFGSLPSNTHNQSEKTVPEDVVRTAYWDWLKWAEGVFDVDWEGLAEEVSAREQSPITYPLELLKNLGKGGRVDPAEWLREREDRNGRLTQRAKRAIFDAFFKQSYGPY